MQKLVKGIHQLRTVEFRPSHALFQLPSRGRGPELLLIVCSDLGIDPYSLIPTNMVDLYVMQNFGNLVAPYDPRHPDVASSVEMALAVYPVKDIVICGHIPCDVIRNLLALDDTGDAETPAIANALRHAQRTRHVTAEHYHHLEGEPLLTAPIEENVLVQLENLRTLPAVASRLNRGDLHLHGWVYEPGAIFVYDPHQEQFGPLLQ
jgi:carbonic anhydrase